MKHDTKNGVQGQKWGWGSVVPVLIILFGLNSAKTFYHICYPTFPEFDSQHRPIPLYGPLVKDNAKLTIDLSVSHDGSKRTHIDRRTFLYSWDQFEGFQVPVTVNVSRARLDTKENANIWLHAVVFSSGKEIASAQGRLLKYLPEPAIRPKRYLLSGERCIEPSEFKRSGGRVVRGIPQMKVELVHDQKQYPGLGRKYPPALFADEFWLTNDALVKLNGTERESFNTKVWRPDDTLMVPR